MQKQRKPAPPPFTFTRKWVIWSTAIVALGILAAKDEVGAKNQFNMLLSVLGIFIVFPYVLINVNRFLKHRKAKKEAAIAEFDQIDKSVFSLYSANQAVTQLGYVLLILFIVSLVSVFFGDIDLVAIFGIMYLISIGAGMLFSRKHAFTGSRFWYFYLIYALVIVILFDFALLFMGTFATMLIFPWIFALAAFPIFCLILKRPPFGAESPYKWQMIGVNFAILVAIGFAAL